jgi:hypothetical protein
MATYMLIIQDKFGTKIFWHLGEETFASRAWVSLYFENFFC